MKRILLRADDFGYSRAVNYGIIDSIKHGIVNNVGIMTNMSSVPEMIGQLKDLPIDLGLHVNLTNGRPLSDLQLVPSLVDEQGNFLRSQTYREKTNKGQDILDVKEATVEIKAQYQEFVRITGREPDYFEGHAIASDSFAIALEQVARERHLPYLPLPKSKNMISSFKTKTKFHFVMGGYQNGQVDPDYDPLELLQACLKQAENKEIPMLVSHAGYLDEYLLKNSSLTIPRVKEAAAWMSQEAKCLVAEAGVKLIRYSECE